MSFVRSSKYRHIFGTPYKNDHCYNGLKVTKNSADARFCAVNPKFIAIVLHGTGGGPFLVLPIEQYGRLATDYPTVNGHSNQVIELAWYPFNDNLIASCSDDGEIKVWEIPDGGLTKTIKEPWVALEGHERRVSILEWHPTAEFILASGGMDNKVIIWNVGVGEMQYEISHPNNLLSISWNYDGSWLATTCKDKTLRIIDPRKEEVLSEKKNCFDGTKPAKCVVLKDGRIFTTGFSRMSHRMYALWDSKNLTEPLTLDEVDTGSGVVHLHYDGDNNVIFTIGKGDSQVKYYEVTDVDPFVHFLSMYQGKISQRGFGWMPKRGLNISSCEIARCYILKEDMCQPVSLTVPRKSELFQEDIFPPCYSGELALSADEWIGGKNANPKTIDARILFDQMKSTGKAVTKKSNKPVRSLSQRPAKSTLSPATAACTTSDVNVEELVEDVKKLKATVRKVCRRLKTLEAQLGEAVADDINEEEE